MPSDTTLMTAIEQEGFAITYSSGLAAVYAVRIVEMDLGKGLKIPSGSRLLSAEKNCFERRIPWFFIHHRCFQEK
jgi:hypothetical protein